MTRRLFAAAAIISLLLCLITAALFIRALLGHRRTTILIPAGRYALATAGDELMLLKDARNVTPGGGIPLSPLALFFAVLPAAWILTIPLRRKHDRLRHGLCPRCGYNLRESKTRCPECGTPIPANR